jgi:DNA-binding transcriptional LysR family regulator
VRINWATRMANKQLNDSWDSFRYFLAVARTGTLSAAANQLRIEHTTVGRRIRMREDELKSPLFCRSNQGYELTDAGQRLLRTAEVVESAVVSAKATAVGEQQIAGTVRVGAPDGFGTIFLAPRLGALARLHYILCLMWRYSPHPSSLTYQSGKPTLRSVCPFRRRFGSCRDASRTTASSSMDRKHT